MRGALLLDEPVARRHGYGPGAPSTKPLRRSMTSLRVDAVEKSPLFRTCDQRHPRACSLPSDGLPTIEYYGDQGWGLRRHYRACTEVRPGPLQAERTCVPRCGSSGEAIRQARLDEADARGPYRGREQDSGRPRILPELRRRRRTLTDLGGKIRALCKTAIAAEQKLVGGAGRSHRPGSPSTLRLAGTPELAAIPAAGEAPGSCRGPSSRMP